MDFVHNLPHVNAGLNSLATILLVAGFILVKQNKLQAHKIAMLGCFGVSVVFLICYLIYHFNVPSRKFPGESYPSVKYVYYLILLTHVVLAAAVPFLAVTSIVLGFRNKIEAHKKLVKWTFPIWLYVSITGVVVYLMLYIFFQPPAS